MLKEFYNLKQNVNITLIIDDFIMYKELVHVVLKPVTDTSKEYTSDSCALLGEPSTSSPVLEGGSALIRRIDQAYSFAFSSNMLFGIPLTVKSKANTSEALLKRKEKLRNYAGSSWLLFSEDRVLTNKQLVNSAIQLPQSMFIKKQDCNVVCDWGYLNTDKQVINVVIQAPVPERSFIRVFEGYALLEYVPIVVLPDKMYESGSAALLERNVSRDTVFSNNALIEFPKTSRERVQETSALIRPSIYQLRTKTQYVDLLMNFTGDSKEKVSETSVLLTILPPVKQYAGSSYALILPVGPTKMPAASGNALIVADISREAKHESYALLGEPVLSSLVYCAYGLYERVVDITLHTFDGGNVLLEYVTLPDRLRAVEASALITQRTAQLTDFYTINSHILLDGNRDICDIKTIHGEALLWQIHTENVYYTISTNMLVEVHGLKWYTGENIVLLYPYSPHKLKTTSMTITSLINPVEDLTPIDIRTGIRA